MERLRSKITINAKFEIRDRLSGFSGGCVRVFVCPFVVFCHHTHLNPKYRYLHVHCDTEKTFIIVIFAKLCSEATASFACLRCH